MSQDRKQESALEEFLDRRSRVSEAYRGASGEQPPAALDQAILAASRRAVGSGPRRLGWTRRWGAPLAAAAVLVLGLAVVLRLEHEPQIAQLRETQAPEARQAEAESKARSQPSERDAADIGKAKRDAKTATQSGEAKKASAAADAAPAQPGVKLAAEKPSAPAQPEAGPADQVRARTDAMEARSEPAATPGAATGSAVPGPDTAADAEFAAKRREPQQAMESAKGNELRKQSAAPSPAAPAKPEIWLERIEALYSQGRKEDGDQALREFCRRWPAHAVPERFAGHVDRLGLSCAGGK